MPNPENHRSIEAVLIGGQDTNGTVWDGVAPAPLKNHQTPFPPRRKSFKDYIQGLHREFYTDLSSPDLE